VTTRSPRPILCAIIGDHGAGKRHLAQSLAERLGARDCRTLALDDYVVPRSSDASAPIGQSRVPCEASLALMAQHLRLLRQGETIFKPVVDRSTGQFTTPEFLRPTPVILAHGLHGLASPELRSLWDVSVFVDTGSADAEAQRHVLPQRERADLVLLARTPGGRSARYELRIAHPVPLPALATLGTESEATVLHVSSAAAGPDVIAIDGTLEAVRDAMEQLVADYLVQRTVPRTALSSAEVRSVRPAPGA
jgi:uridine kinase